MLTEDSRESLRRAAAKVADDLISAVPGFRVLHSDNVENYGEFLFAPFYWDVVESTVLSYLGDEDEPDWRSTLEFMEAKIRSDDDAEKSIVVSEFLYNLPNRGQPGHELIRHLGPELTKNFARMTQGR
ncbi:hypothetical protein [Krasilnikovia sp. MM14-A1259]|uniref:hypothetical protein n=1 Tax=Krasilnikovia sp. MM14-A1259 TaxID=3373539 RepID=UPI00380E5D94